MVRFNTRTAQGNQNVRSCPIGLLIGFPRGKVSCRRVLDVKAFLCKVFAPSKKPIFRRLDKDNVVFAGQGKELPGAQVFSDGNPFGKGGLNRNIKGIVGARFVGLIEGVAEFTL